MPAQQRIAAGNCSILGGHPQLAVGVLGIDRAALRGQHDAAAQVGGPDGAVGVAQRDLAVEAIGLQCAAVGQAGTQPGLAGDAHHKIHPGIAGKVALYIRGDRNSIALLEIVNLDGISVAVAILSDRYLPGSAANNMDIADEVSEHQRWSAVDGKAPDARHGLLWRGGRGGWS